MLDHFDSVRGDGDPNLGWQTTPEEDARYNEYLDYLDELDWLAVNGDEREAA
jgi:hypothetical protein